MDARKGNKLRCLEINRDLGQGGGGGGDKGEREERHVCGEEGMEACTDGHPQWRSRQRTQVTLLECTLESDNEGDRWRTVGAKFPTVGARACN